jgi:HNH endonuclease
MTALRIVKRDGTVHRALLDPEDYAEAARMSWHMAGGKGRVGKYVKSVEGFYLHRWVAHRMGLIDSLLPEPGQRGHWSLSVDHRNGNKLDNRRANLRVLDRQHQMRNAADAPRSTNRSGYRGVSFVARRERYGKPWMAYVTVDYRTKNLGWYATVEEAAAARRCWDEEHAKG